MAVPPRSPAPIGGKSAPRPDIFRVRVRNPPIGGKCALPVEIFHVQEDFGVGEVAIARVATGQRGLVHRAQLTSAGFSSSRVRRLVRLGTLIPVFSRVFALGHLAPAPHAADTAALLHIGHDVVLSHRSARALWALGEPPASVELSVIGRDWRAREGLRTHRIAELDSRDVRVRHGLPVTAPARTLIDVAARLSSIDLAELAGDCRARGLVDDAELDDALARAPLRTGTRAVQRLRASPEGRALTRSQFERALGRLLADAELPPALTNRTVNGMEVDAYWPDHRLILECDSWTHHGTRAAFERDRARDQHHLACGDRVTRITYRQLVESPLRIAAVIGRALGDR